MEMKLHIPSSVTVLTWVYCLLIGLVTGSVAFFVGAIVSAFFKNVWAKMIARWIFAEHSLGSYAAYGEFIGFNLMVVVAGSLLVLVLAPAAAGSGIPNMYAYLNGVDIPDFLTLRTALAKVPGSALVVSGGLTIGKEGPLLHIGSIIATFLGRSWPFKEMAKAKEVEPFAYDQHVRDLAACGAAAGLAAGFKAPVGGMLFAMEMASRWRPELTWRCLFTTAVTISVIRFVTLFSSNSCSNGDCAYLSYGSLLFFKVSYDLPDSAMMQRLSEIWLMVLLGLMGGFLGALYTTVNTMMVGAQRWRYRGRMWLRLLDVGLVSVLTSVLRLGLANLGTCIPYITQRDPDSVNATAPGVPELQNYAVYGCNSTSYSDLAMLMFNPQGYVAKALLHSDMHTNSNEFSGPTLLIFFLFYYIMALFAYGTAIPAGLFTPSLIFGSAFGRLFAWCFNNWFGFNLDAGFYAFLGAGAVLGGMFRFAVSFCVVLVELLNTEKQIPYLILVLVFAKGIGDRLNQNILNHLCILLGLEYLGGHPDSTIKRKGFKAGDVANHDMKKLCLFEKKSALVRALENDEYGVFPVVKTSTVSVPGGGTHYGKENFVGMVTSNDIASLLKDLEEMDPNEKLAQLIPADEDEEESGDDYVVNLTAIVQMAPVVIPPNMPLTTVFRLKNASGLEYIPVVETHGPLKGLITRHELVTAQNNLIDPHNLQNRLDKLTHKHFFERAKFLSFRERMDAAVPLLTDVYVPERKPPKLNQRSLSIF